jgi:hypothetical protein
MRVSKYEVHHSWGQSHQHFMRSFYAQKSQKDSQVMCLFALMESACVKAAHKTLMKLTPGCLKSTKKKKVSLNRLFNNINKLSHYHNCPWQVERVRGRALPHGLMFWSESPSLTLSYSLLLLFQFFQSSTIVGLPFDLTLIATEERVHDT